ncbi:DUF2244 domain-containing protein [Citreimonas salinaria]|uniref:Uncharacterized membrane protein n=1 Tax=Citreimonas salinaria TaxID=321339 RepID=A0A1H3K2T6_9RHOB|nr:DUF2244 domain-containing protein [Citreimonas salinaria]SDY46065.1 Uncharacterized membrane protein [Citreimonas salinaria]
MPYAWSAPSPDSSELQLWPHNSLPPAGFAGIVLGFFLMATIPLYWLIGTVVLWGLLPFVMAAVAALYWGLQRNFRDRRIIEILTLSPDRVRLTRHNPRGASQDWESNTYWVQVACHEAGGPVPYYVTLKGHGREVEIGAFLSEDERKALYSELQDRLRSCAGA